MQNFEKLLSKFKLLLKENGLNFTTQRELVLKTLFNYLGHFTPEDLHMLIKKNNPDSNVGVTTIYRTLNLLESNHIVTSISFGIQGKKYELGNKPHHDHLICNQCGKIVEFEDPTIEELQEKIAKMHDFKLTEHIMQLYGVCKDCQDK
ncbi:MAG TPA: transcriptional repressor [Campylobacterales bacterium]|nr:transcriptional repressor [Campylobacterales bacterium]